MYANPAREGVAASGGSGVNVEGVYCIISQSGLPARLVQSKQLTH